MSEPGGAEEVETAAAAEVEDAPSLVVAEAEALDLEPAVVNGKLAAEDAVVAASRPRIPDLAEERVLRVVEADEDASDPDASTCSLLVEAAA